MENLKLLPSERLFRFLFFSASQIETELDLSPDGLTEEQVLSMRRRFGVNRIESGKRSSLFFYIRRSLTSPFHLLLFVMALVALAIPCFGNVAYRFTGITGLVILGILSISTAVRIRQERQAGVLAASLLEQLQPAVQVRRHGKVVLVPSHELVVGDRVLLSSGMRVPADLRILEASHLFVSQALLTGESRSVEKTAAPLPPDTPQTFSHLSNAVFLGTRVVGGSGEGIVAAVGTDTVYGRYTSKLKPQHAPAFWQGANSISLVFLRCIAVLLPVIFLVTGLLQGNWHQAFLFALSVAVGLTPELLPMVVTVCLAKGTSALGRTRTLIKNIQALQAFGSMDVLCLDKTGTLTSEELTLEYYLDILGGESTNVLDMAYLTSWYHSDQDNAVDRSVLRCAEMPRQSAHFAALPHAYTKLSEIPFDYSRKLVSVLVSHEEKGTLLLAKGDVARVYDRCAYAVYQGNIRPIEASGRAAVDMVIRDMQDDGMKVLAVAYKPMNPVSLLTPDDEKDLILLGYIVFFDAPKKSAAPVLQQLASAGVAVKVLTGDQPAPTCSICRRLGLAAEPLYTGGQLAQFCDADWKSAVETSSVFTDLAPHQKARIVAELQAAGHQVGFLGDGMNDISAILAADVGVSVDTAVRAAKESAEVMLLKKDLHIVAQAILEGRRAMANVSKYLYITASSNFGNAFSVAAASLFLPFLPMTALQLLLLNLLCDFMNLTLPWDRVDKDMLRSPRPWSGKGLGRFMRFFGLISSVFDMITFIFLFQTFYPAASLDEFALLSLPERIAFIQLFHTAWFLESLWIKVLMFHLLRTRHVPILESRAGRLPCLVMTAALFALTGLIYTPLAGWFGFVPLPSSYFVFLFFLILGYTIVGTAAKRLYLHRYGHWF